MNDYEWNEVLRGAVVMVVILGSLLLFGWTGCAAAFLAYGAVKGVREWWTGEQP